VRFEDHGQRMILLLGLVKGVPESQENVEQILSLVNLSGIKFTMTVPHGLVWTFWVQICSVTGRIEGVCG
jgi:hypothetical protein